MAPLRRKGAAPGSETAAIDVPRATNAATPSPVARLLCAFLCHFPAEMSLSLIYCGDRPLPSCCLPAPAPRGLEPLPSRGCEGGRGEGKAGPGWGWQGSIGQGKPLRGSKVRVLGCQAGGQA